MGPSFDSYLPPSIGCAQEKSRRGAVVRDMLHPFMTQLGSPIDKTCESALLSASKLAMLAMSALGGTRGLSANRLPFQT